MWTEYLLSKLGKGKKGDTLVEPGYDVPKKEWDEKLLALRVISRRLITKWHYNPNA